MIRDEIPKVLCQIKGKGNISWFSKWKVDCIGCCLHCERKRCKLRTCVGPKSDLCCWKRLPSEYIFTKLDDEADRIIYQLRMKEHEEGISFP